MRRSVDRAPWLIALITILVQLFAIEAPAQTSGPGTLFVLRSQASSIVEEAWQQLADSLLRPGDIWISVEGGSAKRIVENAFLQSLGQRGFRPQLHTPQKPAVEGIQVTILDQAVQYRTLGNGASQREVRTAIEMRRVRAGGENVIYGGPYVRQAIDTVEVRDDGGLAELRNAEERSFVDKMMGPLLLISGAFLIVYLFFTVRN